MKMYYTSVLLAGLATVCMATSYSGSISTCNQRYQEALTEALNIKRGCKTAALYDCCQIKTLAPTVATGIYEISTTSQDGPFSSSKLYTRCDMDSDNGGWTIIQRRVANGRTDFFRNWNDYELGFGNLEEEFWLGLQDIHRLTTRDEVELRIDLQDEQGNNVTWTYQTFRVDGPADKYRLHIGEGEGTPAIRDSMAYHNNQQFTTQDRDNDRRGGSNCAQYYHGAWWYNDCHSANLNGPHVIPPSAEDPTPTQVVWYSGTAWVYYPNVEMKVRPKTCHLRECETAQDTK